MRYFKYNGKLARETSHIANEKVIFFEYVEEADKDRCRNCGHTVEIQHNIVEGCLNWQSGVESVETIKK